jgi:predicted RNA-binding protein with PIN domain
MPYLLDGNNLIGQARGVSRPSEEDRGALIAELAERLRRTQAKAILFFDGPGDSRSSLGSLSIRGAGPAGADEAILREIVRSRVPGENTVVTADRDLARRAREAGARTASPDEFWRSFGTSNRGKRQGADRDEERVDVADWLKYFQNESNRDR